MSNVNGLDTHDVERLDAVTGGELLQPGDDGYEQARRLWNGMIDKHPALILRCKGPDDVIAGVRFARGHRLPLSVKGGGHNAAGRAVCDDGLMLDLAPMNHVEVNPGTRTAVVGGGARLRDLDAATQKHGLATTAGTDSRTGIAGLTLGGGLGYLARKHGLALDNVVGLTVVTADGELRHASESDHPDLFWGLRGGGGNLGVVTAFEFRLHELGPEVLTVQAFYPHEQGRDVLRFYRELHVHGPDEASLLAAIANVPPMPPFPEERHGQTTVALIGMYAGDIEAGRQVFAPLETLGKPMLRAIEPMPYIELQAALEAGGPDGMRYYGKSRFLSALPDAAIDTVLEHTAELPGPFSTAFFEPMGGAINRVAQDATAFPSRDAAFNFSPMAGYDDAAMDEAARSWARGLYEAMAPYATGCEYMNYLVADDMDKLHRAYGPHVERLAALKARYDPDNLFSGNVNVAPSR